MIYRSSAMARSVRDTAVPDKEYVVGPEAAKAQGESGSVLGWPIAREEFAAITEFRRYSTAKTPRPVGMGRPGPHYPMPLSLQSCIEGGPVLGQHFGHNLCYIRR